MLIRICGPGVRRQRLLSAADRDRKSTRLNSSHSQISYAVFCLTRRPATSPLFPYTTLFRSRMARLQRAGSRSNMMISLRGETSLLKDSCPSGWEPTVSSSRNVDTYMRARSEAAAFIVSGGSRSEEHTSELQSQSNLVCRLLLDTATSDISPLSLHDALPISNGSASEGRVQIEHDDQPAR